MFGNIVRVTTDTAITITTTTAPASTKLFVECIEECVIMNHLTFREGLVYKMAVIVSRAAV